MTIYISPKYQIGDIVIYSHYKEIKKTEMCKICLGRGKVETYTCVGKEIICVICPKCNGKGSYRINEKEYVNEECYIVGIYYSALTKQFYYDLANVEIYDKNNGNIVSPTHWRIDEFILKKKERQNG